MPKKKRYEEKGGSNQKAKRAKAVAVASGVVVEKKEERRKRRRKKDEESRAPLLDSKAAFHWLQQWSWGKMSSIEVKKKEAYNNYFDYQRMLHNTHLNEGWMPISIHELAKLGTWGEHPGNINGELKHWLGEPTLPKAMMVTVPMVIPKGPNPSATTKEVAFPIILPHEAISHVYHHHRAWFNMLYIGAHNVEDAPLHNFWDTVEARGDPRLLEHPMCLVPRWKRTYVPLSLHGDAVPVTKVGKSGSKSMDVYSTSGLLGVGTTRALKLYMFGIFTSSEVKEGRNTMQTILPIIMWSLQAAFDGKFPTHYVDSKEVTDGNAGKDLTGGLRFVLLSLKADLDHWAKAYGLTHYNSNDPCEFCTASRKGHPLGWHNYFGKDASWRQRSFSATQWRSLYNQSELHWIFGFKYLSCHNLEVDELHVMHLGTTVYMLGAVLYTLCFHVLESSPEESMQNIWAKICDFYTNHNIDPVLQSGDWILLSSQPISQAQRERR